MQTMHAKPQLLKQVNLTALRQVLAEGEAVTRGDLAARTGLSFATVRTLLETLLQRGEIETAGCQPSSGGRRATQYRLAHSRSLGAAICIGTEGADGLLLDAGGRILSSTPLTRGEEDFLPAVTAYLDQLTAQQALRAIGIGIPGVVEGERYWKKRHGSDQLVPVPLGHTLAQRYGTRVVLENDLNATALGFGHCHRLEFPAERPNALHLVYLHVDRGCIGAGILSGGQVVRGWRNFAGELGLLPLEGRPLDAWLLEPPDRGRHVTVLTQLLVWVCGLLNPQYVALGGPSLHRDDLDALGGALLELLPSQLQPELLHAPDRWSDYHAGMAQLTAQRMFSAVQVQQLVP